MGDVGLDIFLEIDGIDGESTDPDHPGELQLISFTKGVSNSPKGWGPGISTWSDATFTMHVDKSYPKLEAACTAGNFISKVVLTVRKAGRGQKGFLVVTFSDVLISNCLLTSSSNFKHRAQVTDITPDPAVENLMPPGVPIVQFSINFARIKEEYKVQNPDGSLAGSLDYSYSLQQATAQGR